MLIKRAVKLKNHSGNNEEGVVLLVVLLILSLVSVMVLSWGQEWGTELKLTSNFREANQCRRLAEAGVYYALGKLVAAKSMEMAATQSDSSGRVSDNPVEIWQGDREVHFLELPEGRVEVRVEDEGGKIFLNSAPEGVLLRLFTALGFPEFRVRTMVDSVLDWRNPGDHSRTYGAKSDYYLKLDPPYLCKNAPFEVVEELSWVRGFESSPLIARVGEWFTVQRIGNAVNINTAPVEVLQAMGFSRENAATITAHRKTQPINGVAEISKLITNPTIGQELGISFKPSPYVTIISQGVKESGGRYTIKAIAHLAIDKPTPWKILAWIDDYPQ